MRHGFSPSGYEPFRGGIEQLPESLSIELHYACQAHSIQEVLESDKVEIIAITAESVPMASVSGR
jgi:hypothetical protein